jgi:transposase
MIDIKYVAFDVHKSTISIAVLNLNGELVTQAVIKTDASAIHDFLRGLSGLVHLTFEEGTHAQWLYELTRGLVARLVVCNARHSASKGNKSDKLDALKLAQLLRAGLLKAVYHGSPSTQTLKQVVHCYDSLTEDTTRVMNRIKALFRSQAIACSGRDVYYSRNRSQWLGKLKEEGLKLRAEFLYKQLDQVRTLRRDAKKQMLTQARKHSAFKRLCRVPGLGPIRVAQVIAAVGTPVRFRSRRQFWAYCGFAVVTRSSADYEYQGSELRRRVKSAQTRGLNREYSRRLKRVFKAAAVEAQAVEAQKDERIRRIYTRQVEKGVRPEMARLSVARKLAAVTLSVWKSGQEYDESKMTRQAA